MSDKNRVTTLGKSLAKYLLPQKAVSHYRRKVRQSVDKSVIIIVLDSCRYDSFTNAHNNQLPAEEKKAYSPSNWTIPGHSSIVRGFLPFGTNFSPPLDEVGYDYGFPLPPQHQYSFGCTALPYLSESPVVGNPLSNHFEEYYCAEKLDSAKTVLNTAREFLEPRESFFGLINLGETHSPYRNYDSRNTQDIIKGLDNGKFTYEGLHNDQASAAGFLIQRISTFRDYIPEGTRVVVTSDHGELFGENGGFGHNPHKKAVFHRKLFEVPLITWVE